MSRWAVSRDVIAQLVELGLFTPLLLIGSMWLANRGRVHSRPLEVTRARAVTDVCQPFVVSAGVIQIVTPFWSPPIEAEEDQVKEALLGQKSRFFECGIHAPV